MEIDLNELTQKKTVWINPKNRWTTETVQNEAIVLHMFWKRRWPTSSEFKKAIECLV